MRKSQARVRARRLRFRFLARVGTTAVVVVVVSSMIDTAYLLLLSYQFFPIEFLVVFTQRRARCRVSLALTTTDLARQNVDHALSSFSSSRASDNVLLRDAVV